ncbi:MAG: hypothetical protein GX131_13850 [candidate division WS1 bacterium]|jgi:hypothetical protein|nr:hypothetical protein [candidate division WS1 bacterium]
MLDRRLIVLMTLCVIVILAGCEGGETTDGLERGTLIGPGGGTILSPDRNATVEVPDAAIDEPQQFTCQEIGSPEPDPGLVADTAYRFSPDGYLFDAPVTLTINYREANIPTGVDEASLQIARLEASEWVPVAASVIDATDNSVSASITGFSTFAVVGDVSAPEE